MPSPWPTHGLPRGEVPREARPVLVTGGPLTQPLTGVIWKSPCSNHQFWPSSPTITTYGDRSSELRQRDIVRLDLATKPGKRWPVSLSILSPVGDTTDRGRRVPLGYSVVRSWRVATACRIEEHRREVVPLDGSRSRTVRERRRR